MSFPWLPASGACCALLTVIASSACARREPPQPTVGSLSGVAARVGDVVIPAAAVGACARAQGLSARSALEQLVDDALLAQGARVASPVAAKGVPCSLEWASARVLSLDVSRRLRRDPRLRTPPTAEERQWHQVLQAVVLREAGVSRARAQQVAAAVAAAVASARDAADFEARAKGVPHSGVGLRVDDVPAFDAKGVTGDGTRLDPSLVAATFGLHRPGDTSGVVESPFGWHVLRLVGLQPPPVDGVSLPAEADVDPDVVEMRARRELDELLSQLRSQAGVSVAPGADGLMAKAYAPFGDSSGSP